MGGEEDNVLTTVLGQNLLGNTQSGEAGHTLVEHDDVGTQVPPSVNGLVA